MAKLLVVDDEKNLRLVIQKELTRQGHETEAAADGQAAWEMMEARDYDVLLCDINMPRLDGMGLLRRLKEKMPNPPEVIMLTGQGTVETAIEAMKLGAYDYLTKPYRIAERNIERILFVCHACTAPRECNASRIVEECVGITARGGIGA